MMLLWVTLLLLHQGHTMVPVTPVQLGESATLTCVLPAGGLSSERLQWYKQSARDTLKLIVVLKKHSNPLYGPKFSISRMDVNFNEGTSNLTILRTIEEDEGMYHCAVVDWIKITWSGTYLSLKENYVKSVSNDTVATCWETLSGNGAELQIEGTSRPEFIALVIALVCLVISLIGNIVFICLRKSGQFKGTETASSQARHCTSMQPVHDLTEGGDDLNYAALHFTGRPATRERKSEESVYSQVKC